MKHRLAAACLVFALAAASPLHAGDAPATDAPAGVYSLDKAHASLIFRVNHLGFSRYTARFTRFDAELKFDPGNPAASSVTATVDPLSLQTDYPDPALDFNAVLTGADWLDAAKFPKIGFRSTAIEVTGPDKARITGELSLHGVTQPVTLEATFNGGYAGHPMDPGGARIGFSAHGAFSRSAFGVSLGVPAAGSNMGVGDPVEVIIEAEFLRPAAAKSSQ